MVSSNSLYQHKAFHRTHYVTYYWLVLQQLIVDNVLYNSEVNQMVHCDYLFFQLCLVVSLEFNIPTTP